MGACSSVHLADGDEADFEDHTGGKRGHPDQLLLEDSHAEVEASPTSKASQLDGVVAEKRMAVAANPLLAGAAGVDIPSYPKSAAEIATIETAVKGNLLFDTLSRPAQLAIFDSMVPLEVPAGTAIIQQGDVQASKFFVLVQGRCEVLIYDKAAGCEKHVHTYNPPSSFGELALLYSAPRAATVRAVAACRLWVMERAVYNVVKSEFIRAVQEEKRNLLANAAIFSHLLSAEQKSTVADALEHADFQDQQVIYSKGDEGDVFYLIKEGEVEMRGSNGNVVSSLGPGLYFGEQALTQGSKVRDLTAVAKGYTVCFTLEGSAFKDLMGPLEHMWKFTVLKRMPILFNLKDRELWQIAVQLQKRVVHKDEVVIQQGEPGDSFFIIEDGVFRCYLDSGKLLARIGKGSGFGELALLREELRACNVSAEVDSTLLVLDRQTFNSTLGNLAEIRHMWRFEALRRVKLLARLTPAQRSALCTVLKSQTYEAGTMVVCQGDVGDRFFLIEAGRVQVVKDGAVVSTLSAGQCFGELALLSNQPRAASVVSLTTTSLLELDRRDFQSLLGPLQDILQKQAAAYDGVASNKTSRRSMSLKDLEHVKVLGSGAFGEVSLVRMEGLHYALKAMSKLHVVESELVDHVHREKSIMLELRHPFLVNLMAAFQDQTHVYMLMELCKGGELFSYLRKRKQPLPERHARFYVAAVVLVFEHFADCSVVYRDLKPENLLLDEDGYIKVTDLGFAKKVPPGERTYTLCGTPEYLAPELVTQQGHSRAVDWWAVGILIFEMCCGLPPFYADDRVEMFRRICSGRIHFPQHCSPEMRHLVSNLLALNPMKRLGMGINGAGDVKQHAWFEGFNWHAFVNKQIPAPYIPAVEKVLDPKKSAVDKKMAAIQKRSKRYVSTGAFKNF